MRFDFQFPNKKLVKTVKNNSTTTKMAAVFRVPYARVLTISGNLITHLPDTLFSKCKSLEELWVRNNLLEALPSTLVGAPVQAESSCPIASKAPGYGFNP
jgi:hypothetical protein